MVYVYLVLSAMFLILITRTKRYFWQDYPSKAVGLTQLGDIILTVILAILGIAMDKISWTNLAITLLVALVAAIVIDLFYQPIMKNR